MITVISLYNTIKVVVVCCIKRCVLFSCHNANTVVPYLHIKVCMAITLSISTTWLFFTFIWHSWTFHSDCSPINNPMETGMVHSQHSKMKKELAGCKPANYSYGRCIPMNDASDSNWNFPKIPNDIYIPCGNAGNGIIDECN